MIPVLIAVAGGLLPLACAPATVPVPASASTIAFVGVSVVPMTGPDSLLPDHTVLVRGGRIAAVGPAATVAIPAGAHRIDGRGLFLMPGLIDTHVHLEYFDDPAALMLFLVNGVTTVRNMDGRPFILEWRRRIAAAELRGPSIVTAGPILDGDPPILDDNTVVRNAAEARAAVAAQDSAGYDFVKVYTGIGPEAYFAALDEARTRGRPVAGHVPRRLTIADVVQAGQHSIEHLSDFDDLIESDSSSIRGRFHWSRLFLAIDADAAKMRDAARLVADARTWVVPTIVQADRALAPADSLQSWLGSLDLQHVPADVRGIWQAQAVRAAARLDSADWAVVARGRANRRALLAALRSAGAKTAIGTDTPNAFVVPGLSVHQELANFAESGFSARAALAAATRDAARLLDEPAGTIEAGRRADAVLLSGNPLADVGNARAPIGVMTRGVWLSRTELDSMRVRLRGSRWVAPK